MPNFIKIGQSVAEILVFFQIFKMAIYLFKVVKFYWLTRVHRARHTTVPNSVKIGQSVVEMLQFFFFFKVSCHLAFVWGISEAEPPM